MKTVVVIPCYNEVQDVGSLVIRAKKYVDDVIVVDNGSYDTTAVEAEKNGATVVYSHRKGMGAAIAKGMAKIDSDIYITMDGDGQHNPDEIPLLVEPVLLGRADLAVGIRHNDGIPAYRLFGNQMLSRVYNFGAGGKLVDVQCGFRAFNTKVKDISLDSCGFGCVFELLVKARKLGYIVQPVDISCRYFKDLKHNSTINPIKHGMIAMYGAMKWRMWELF